MFRGLRPLFKSTSVGVMSTEEPRNFPVCNSLNVVVMRHCINLTHCALIWDWRFYLNTYHPSGCWTNFIFHQCISCSPHPDSVFLTCCIFIICSLHSFMKFCTVLFLWFSSPNVQWSKIEFKISLPPKVIQSHFHQIIQPMPKPMKNFFLICKNIRKKRIQSHEFWKRFFFYFQTSYNIFNKLIYICMKFLTNWNN